MGQDDVKLILQEYSGRYKGLLNALTKEQQKLFELCNPETDTLSLFGKPDGTWTVELPVMQVPTDLPEPVVGINYPRDSISRQDWLLKVAQHSEAWLMAIAHHCAGKNPKEDRVQIFSTIINNIGLYQKVEQYLKMNPNSLQQAPSKSGQPPQQSPPQAQNQQQMQQQLQQKQMMQQQQQIQQLKMQQAMQQQRISQATQQAKGELPQNNQAQQQQQQVQQTNNKKNSAVENNGVGGGNKKVEKVPVAAKRQSSAQKGSAKGKDKGKDKKKKKRKRKGESSEDDDDEADEEPEQDEEMAEFEEPPPDNGWQDGEGDPCPICKRPYNISEFWIACDKCETWYCGKCTKLTEAKANAMDHWHCQNCQQ